MADFCFQCNVDHYFGPYSDFDNMERIPGFQYRTICEGCGVILVDAKGWCIDPLCTLHHGHADRYAGAVAWLARRVGPLGVVYRYWDGLAGTPWQPGSWHVGRLRWWRDLARAVYHGKDMGYYGYWEEEPDPFDMSHLGALLGQMGKAFAELGASASALGVEMGKAFASMGASLGTLDPKSGPCYKGEDKG